MKTFKTATIISLLTIVMLAAFCSTTYAITGNSHPNTIPYVGIVVLFSDATMTHPLSFSTGILISQTVVLTAGHSVIGGEVAIVCFDQDPITYSRDETGKINFNTNKPVYRGDLKPYPEYEVSLKAVVKDSKLLQTSDVGLIVLDTPVQEVQTFPALPTEGLADSLPVNSALQVIGYGVQDQITPRNGDISTWVGSITRNSATVNLLSTNFQGSNNYLKCSANAAQGKGGVAYGDSGGPVLYNDNGQTTILAVNAYVNNANCEGVTFHTRIDNPQVLGWIKDYI